MFIGVTFGGYGGYAYPPPHFSGAWLKNNSDCFSTYTEDTLLQALTIVGNFDFQTYHTYGTAEMYRLIDYSVHYSEQAAAYEQ